MALNDCGSGFDFPEVKKPDAGMVPCDGILGLRKIDQVMFCPEYFSTKIQISDYSLTLE